MKVMCISENFFNTAIGGKPPIHPKFAEILTVVSINDDNDCYEILEYPSNGVHNYSVWRIINFATISNIDEMELVKERELIC